MISFPTQTLYFSTQKPLLFCAKIFPYTKTYLYCTKNLIFPPCFFTINNFRGFKINILKLKKAL